MVDLEKLKQNKNEALAEGKEKIAKPKLTKEQKIHVTQLVGIENRIAVCREYISLWLNFFRFLAEDLTTREIKPEEEKVFFQLMTQLAKKHFLFTEMTGGVFDRGADVLGVLITAISLANVQSMADTTREKLELDWHGLYLDMNKTLGRLIRMLPGNPSLTEALAAMDKLTPVNAAPAAAKPAKK